MTKAVSRTDFNDRFRDRRARFHGARNSDYRISTSNPKSPTRKDIGSRKKVKFTGLGEQSPTHCRLEASDIPSEREKVTTCADNTDPKTSEYAFFKKLKKDAGQRVHSYSLQKVLEKPESRDYSRERTGNVSVGSKVINSSRVVEDVSTFKTDSFLSPSGGDLNKSGNQYVHGEIFSRKRQRLCQYVADALFPDGEKLCEKGHDIVSMLLSRLFPTSNEENKYADLNSGKIMNATGYDLHDSQESDVKFEEHHQMSTRKLLELESNSYFGDHLLSSRFLRSDERIIPHADTSTLHSLNVQPLYITEEPECEFGPTSSVSAKNDVTHGYPNELVNTTRYGLLDSRESDVQFKEHRQMPLRKLLELESSSCFREHFPPMFLRSDERIISHADSPTSHSRQYQPLYSITEPEDEFCTTSSFSAKSDVTLGFLFNEVVNATRYGLLDSQNSDVQFKEHHRTPKRKFLELESNSYTRDQLLSPMFPRSDEKIIPHADFPTYLSHKFQPLYSITEPQCEVCATPSFGAKCDVTLEFLFNRQEHETFTLNCFKEQGKLKREPIPLLMEKDFDSTADQINLPTYNYAKPDMAPSLSKLGNGEEQMLNNVLLSEYHFRPSSLLLDMPRDFNSTVDYGLSRYQEFRFENYSFVDGGDMETNFNHTALSSSPNNDTSCVRDNSCISPSREWIRTIFNDYHHRHYPDTEAWLSSLLGRSCLSLTSFSTLQLPQREIMFSLHPSFDNHQPEMDGGNHGVKLYHSSEEVFGIQNSSFLHIPIERDNEYSLPPYGTDYISGQEQTHKMLP